MCVCVFLHVLGVHAHGGPRLVLGIIFNCSSILFSEVGSLSPTESILTLATICFEELPSHAF